MPLRPWQAFCAASRVPPAAADPAGAFVFWDWRFRLSRGIFPAMKLDRLLEMPGTELSDVLAHAVENSILITIQAHQNAIAVATLAGIRAILACSSRPIPADMLASARKEGVGIYRTPLNQFDASVAVHQLLASAR